MTVGVAASQNLRPIRSQPLWARVDANRTKLAWFVALFVAGSAILLALALVGVPGALVGAVFAGDGYWTWYAVALGGAVLLLLFVGSLLCAVQLVNARDWVSNRFKGRELRENEAPALQSAVQDTAIAAGLTLRPSILLLEDEGCNAFVLGTSRERATIGVTKGMLAQFTTDEVRAVVATLVARVIAGDIMFGTALAALMGPLAAVRESRRGAGKAAGGCADLAGAGDGCGDPGCGDPGCSGCGDIGSSDDALGCIGIVVFIAVVIAATYVAVMGSAWVVTLWGRALNRTSYEKADAEGMLLLKNPAPMLSALRKAVRSSTLVSDGDQSYDGIFYTSTSGTPRIEKVERRRFERLRQVVGVEGMAADLDDPTPVPPE